MNHAVLAAGRIIYAFAAGIALVLASLDPANTAAVGSYTLQSGIAAAVAAILPLGLDRALARRRATDSTSDFPASLIRLRLTEIAVVLVVAVTLAWAFTAWFLALACAVFAITRLVYADLESLWIASGRSEFTLSVTIALNGIVTAIGIYAAAPFGGSAMVALSALGNLIAFVALGLLGRWRVNRESLRPFTKEALGFGGSAALAVAYGRADLLILALTGANLEAVAVYGIITRMFDALGLIRGSIAQVEMRRLAPMLPHDRAVETTKIANTTALVSAGLSVATIGATYIILALPVFEAWAPFSAAVLIASVSIPAYAAHLSTAALVLSDRRAHLLFVGSIISTICAVGAKLILILEYGVNGAVFAIGLVELISFVVFMTLYRSGVSARRITVSAAIPAISTMIGFCIVVIHS